jgi:Delta3-Delta2-enoyl-CoA isomerase
VSKVTIEKKENVAVVKLSDGVTNVIGPELVDDLSKMVPKLKNEYDGVVLAGGEKFFSIGLDLPTLITFDRKQLGVFFDSLNQLVLDLFTLPIPSICAMAGHAIAAGNILAMACDYRFMADGKKLIGLNERKIGIPAPYVADIILRQIVGDRTATNILYSGDFLSPSDALEVGLVDAVFPQETLESSALERMSSLTKLPLAAFAAIKENRVETIREKYDKYNTVRSERFLDCWLSDSTQKLLNEALKSF